MWANGLILAAAIATALALVPISMRFEGGARTWGWVGLVTFAFAAVFGVIDRMISIQVTTWAAPRYGDATVSEIFVPFDRFGAVLGSAFILLGFLAITFYGVAMLRTPSDDGLGWLFVGFGVLGMLSEAVGVAIPGMVYFGTAGLGIASWRRTATVEVTP